MNTSENILYQWSFSTKKDRGQLWYIIALAVVFGLIIWGMLSKQYVLWFLVIIATGVYALLENNSEDEAHVQITPLGIRVNKEFYNFGSIGGYSIVYNGDQAIYLQLSMQKSMIKTTNLHINNQIALELEQVLPHFLQNIGEWQMTVVDRILNILKL